MFHTCDSLCWRMYLHHPPPPVENPEKVGLGPGQRRPSAGLGTPHPCQGLGFGPRCAFVLVDISLPPGESRFRQYYRLEANLPPQEPNPGSLPWGSLLWQTDNDTDTDKNIDTHTHFENTSCMKWLQLHMAGEHKDNRKSWRQKHSQ